MVKKAGKILFIEGTTDDTNGNLRGAFGQLLEKKLKDNKKMPRIKMCDGRHTAVDQFKNGKLEGERLLLVDLDAPLHEKEKVITVIKMVEHSAALFFMVQEMEAWFLSQPEVLDKYFNAEISKKIPKKNVSEIGDPSDFLKDITKGSKKGSYHKVRDGVSLLPLLDLDKLEKYFDEVKLLLNALSK